MKVSSDCDDVDLARQTGAPHPGLTDHLGIEGDGEAVDGGLECRDQLLTDVGGGGRGRGRDQDLEPAVAELLHAQPDLGHRGEWGHVHEGRQIPCDPGSGQMLDSDKKVLVIFDTILSFGAICTLSKSGNERRNLQSMNYWFMCIGYLTCIRCISYLVE